MYFKKFLRPKWCRVRHAGVAPLAVLAVALLLSGCGDDNGAGFKPELVMLPPSSPDNVLNNMVVCYNERDIDQLTEVLDEDFTFRFTQHDMQHYDEMLPDGGIWGKSKLTTVPAVPPTKKSGKMGPPMNPVASAPVVARILAKT